MQRLNARASCTAIILFLVCVCGLTACKPSYTKPDNAPMAPRVNCDAGPAAQLPPIPGMEGAAELLLQVMGLYQAEVEKRASMRRCLSDMRSKGVIR